MGDRIKGGGPRPPGRAGVPTEGDSGQGRSPKLGHEKAVGAKANAKARAKAKAKAKAKNEAKAKAKTSERRLSTASASSEESSSVFLESTDKFENASRDASVQGRRAREAHYMSTVLGAAEAGPSTTDPLLQDSPAALAGVDYSLGVLGLVASGVGFKRMVGQAQGAFKRKEWGQLTQIGMGLTVATAGGVNGVATITAASARLSGAAQTASTFATVATTAGLVGTAVGFALNGGIAAQQGKRWRRAVKTTQRLEAMSDLRHDVKKCVKRSLPPGTPRAEREQITSLILQQFTSRTSDILDAGGKPVDDLPELSADDLRHLLGPLSKKLDGQTLQKLTRRGNDVLDTHAAALGDLCTHLDADTIFGLCAPDGETILDTQIELAHVARKDAKRRCFSALLNMMLNAVLFSVLLVGTVAANVLTAGLALAVAATAACIMVGSRLYTKRAETRSAQRHERLNAKLAVHQLTAAAKAHAKERAQLGADDDAYAAELLATEALIHERLDTLNKRLEELALTEDSDDADESDNEVSDERVKSDEASELNLSQEDQDWQDVHEELLAELWAIEQQVHATPK